MYNFRHVVDPLARVRRPLHSMLARGTGCPVQTRSYEASKRRVLMAHDAFDDRGVFCTFGWMDGLAGTRLYMHAGAYGSPV